MDGFIVNEKHGVAVNADGTLIWPPNFFDANAEARLAEIAAAEGYKALSNVVYYPGGQVQSADVVWPDGSLGVYSATLNPQFNTIDAFAVTHANSGKTVTQPAITRNASGQIITQPAITIT